MEGAGLLRLGCSVLAAGGVEGLGELLVERQAVLSDRNPRPIIR
jgi:hypothetical protein